MQVKFTSNDIVVLVSAYGQMLVRTDIHNGDEVYVVVVPTDDPHAENDSFEVLWRGNLDGCMKALTTDLGVLMAQEAVWRQPNEILVKN